MRKKILYSTVAAFMVFPVISMAEESHEDKIKTLDEVVVTATRTPTTLGRIGGSSVTVITAEDIEAKKYLNIKDIIKGAPNIDVVSNGGLGSSTSVFMRGADSKNTLILLDGIMVNDPSSIDRSANIANFTVDNIERIEIVRGPLSVLYGSNATAGVINIITKKGSGKPSFYAGAEGGSFKTWKAYGGTDGSLDKFNYSLSASLIDTEGFSAANADNDRIPQGPNTSEKDGWDNSTLSGQFGFDITSQFSINAVFRYMESEIREDSWNFAGYAYDNPSASGSKEQRTESDQIFGKVSMHNILFDDFLQSELYIQGAKQDRQSYFNTGAKSYDFAGEDREFGWQGTLDFSNNILSLGALYFEEEMTSASSTINDQKTNTKSLWFQDQLFIGESFDIVAGLRVDQHDRFGSEPIYRIAPAYMINETQTLLKASYGTGYRAPSLYELFHPVIGNVNLEPEKSTGWDVGFEQSLDNQNISFGATYFDDTYDNRIAWDWTIPTIWGGAYNQLPGSTDISGVEVFTNWQVTNNLDLVLNYSYLTTKDPDGKALPRRPFNKCSLNIRYRFLEKGLLNTDIFWVGDRDAIPFAADLNGNPVSTLDSYTVVNISAHYDLSDTIQIYGRIDNLFDEEYEEAWSYATPNLSGYIGLKAKF